MLEWKTDSGVGKRVIFLALLICQLSWTHDFFSLEFSFSIYKMMRWMLSPLQFFI